MNTSKLKEKMTKKNLTILVVCAVFGIFAIILWARYNALVTAEQNVESAWSEVQNQYQRRLELIPNLVNTVKGYAAHEENVLTAVTEARAHAAAVQVDPTNATPEQLAAYQAAQNELSQALVRINAVAENYPDLKASTNFAKLQDELAGTENRISNARNLFINYTKEYNSMRRRFPTNIVAGMFGFGDRAYFQAAQGAEQAPNVEF